MGEKPNRNHRAIGWAVCAKNCTEKFKWHKLMPNGILFPMSASVQIDQSGRLVLPKPLRDRFRLKAGDSLAINVTGEAIELRPAKASARLEKVNGVLILAGSPAMEAGRDLTAEARDERLEELLRRSGAGQ